MCSVAVCLAYSEAPNSILVENKKCDFLRISLRGQLAVWGLVLGSCHRGLLLLSATGWTARPALLFVHGSNTWIGVGLPLVRASSFFGLRELVSIS